METDQSTLEATRSPDALGIEDIRSLAEDDMVLVNETVRSQLSSNVALINQLGHYIVNSGGKRLRPLLVVLAARACGYQGKQHIDLAAIVEFIHTATLLHDDVVDESNLRRGQDTANALWGNSASVLVGDFLYSRSFQMMVRLQSMRIMEILADTTNVIAEGEVMQLLNVNNPDTTEEQYLQVIHCKTARLFEAGGRLGAVVSNQSPEIEEGVARYAMHLGTAFQLIDDVLDYSASVKETGKNIGDDLAEGKPTLPLLYAMRHGSEQQATIVRKAIEKGGREHIDEILAAIETTGAIQYTSRLARDEARRAVDALGLVQDSPYKRALIGLADFSANRTH